MKNFIYAIIIIILLATLPVIPYEKELSHGITIIESKTVVSWVWEHYQYTQEQNKQVAVEEKEEEQAPVAQ